MHKQEFSGAYRYGCAPCIDVADDLASSLQDMVADQISRSNKETTQVQQQRNLPPLQEVIKPESTGNYIARPKIEDEWDYHTNFLPSNRISTQINGSTHLQPGAPVVSTADLSLENSQFYSDCSSMLSTTNGWVSNAQYSTPPLPYTINTTSSPAYCTKPGMSTPRNQQNLPSLNDMNLPGSSPVYAGRTSQMPRQYAQPQYFNTTSTDPMDISYSKGPHVTYGTPYGIVTNARSSYTVPGCTEWSPVSDMYYTNGQSWPPSMPCSQPTYVGSDTSSLSGGRRRRGNLPKHVTDILRAWFQDHLDHPYPTEEDKQALMRQTNLSISQISNWFINARRRHWPQMKQNRENSRSVHSRSLC